MVDGLKEANTNASEMMYFYPKAKDENENSLLKMLDDLRSAADNQSEEEDVLLDLKKQQLDSMLKQCEMLNRVLFTTKSWNGLMKIYAKTKGVSLKENASLKDLKKAINELLSALTALKKTEKRAEDKSDGHKEGLPLVLELGGGEQSSLQTSLSADVSAVSVDVNL